MSRMLYQKYASNKFFALKKFHDIESHWITSNYIVIYIFLNNLIWKNFTVKILGVKFYFLLVIFQ